MTLKKLLALTLAIFMLAAIAACSSASPSASQNEPGDATSPGSGDTVPADDTTPADDPNTAATVRIGVSMPTKDLQRWNQDGDYLKGEFEGAGYEVDLQYANNEAATQVSQIENMISGGCTVLVIAAVDGYALTQALATAKESGITVIAHDRLIMETDAVSYYATFNNTRVGTLQGQFIVNGLDLENAEGPFNIEFFTGDPGDNNINFFYPGAMAELQPYLDNGKLVCLSGQTEQNDVATVDWKAENAQARMENLISSNGYGPTGTKLDAVMCSNDSTAQGVVTALLGAGYTAENMPIVTGQDCDIVSVKNMIAGLQSMSVFKDTRKLATQVKDMVIAHLAGQTVPTNTEYDNDDALDGTDGERMIPSFECELDQGTPDNYVELLIDSGYYEASELE
jgi:putative multiple sugar transport system substrate-binding protein